MEAISFSILIDKVDSRVAHPLAVGLLFINGRIAGLKPYMNWIPDQVEDDKQAG